MSDYGLAENYDPVNRPQHYAGKKIPPIEVIEAWSLGFCTGNAVKYIARCEDKGAPIEDLQKAVWYLNREIQRRQKERDEPAG